jgi:predicted transcriptional regulator of viral defense system
MKKIDAINLLAALDRVGVYVLTRGDLWKAFPSEKEKAFEKSLQRLVTDGILERVSKGIYVNAFSTRRRGRVVEDISAVLRRGHFSYLSRESMLSEYGLISQVPLNRITLMTTGARGVYTTPYGVIEFNHTKRCTAELIGRTLSMKGRPLRLATSQAALVDLFCARRNVGMVNQDELLEQLGTNSFNRE